MPFYRRGYYRRGRSGYGYRGYNRSWRRRGWSRRGGLSRSSTQGSRRFSVVVPTQAVFNFTVPAGSYWSDLHAVSPYSANPSSKLVHASLVSSLLYRTYTRLYDQAKIDWVSVKISIMTLVGAGGVSPAVKVVTSWDRDIGFNEVTGSNPSDYPTTDSIQSGSESQTSLIVNNSRAVINRFNAASDLQERTVFHDCSLVSVGGSNSYYVDSQYYAQSSQASKSVGYCPGLYMALNAATSPGEGSSFVFTCSLDVKWHVTFRNPKYGLSVGASKSAGDLIEDVVPVKSEGAGKSVAKKVSFDVGSVSDLLPVYSGLVGDVVDRLSASIHDEGVYSDGEYSRDEDIEFSYKKLGDEKFHELFKDFYDVSLRELGLISESNVSKEA